MQNLAGQNRPRTPEPFSSWISHCLVERVKPPPSGGKVKGNYETIDDGSSWSRRPGGWLGMAFESACDAGCVAGGTCSWSGSRSGGRCTAGGRNCRRATRTASPAGDNATSCESDLLY